MRLPRVSNFTDVDALGLEPGLDVVFVSDPRALTDADLVVLPGTRATLADLAWLRERGLDAAIRAHAGAGRPVLGICGGFQMLGRTITDPDGVEGEPGARAEGLGLLDVSTDFTAAKVLGLPRGSALGAATSGYEIHHGRVTRGADVEEFLGGARSESVFGTMWHGSLEGDAFRTAFLAEVARLRGLPWRPSGVSFPAARERRIDLLADLWRSTSTSTHCSDWPAAARPTACPCCRRGHPAEGAAPGLWQAAAVKEIDLETIRLFLHVLAATVWVGGQITLAALVPALRAAGTDVPKAAANAFNRIAWPAFGVLVLTGIWNVIAEGDQGSDYQNTLMLKYTLVLASGVTAYVHAKAQSRRNMAIFGALTGLTALATLFVGIMLAG